ncbi:glutamate-ammonia ligase Gln1 [Schizosaccharomyces cryophilus OY26]|uniref:Glutamine synthetase n=1 Tax=Schizosaccharomyces cryophilus (strain OY26 / ATCC MYA-4695 / CBS 11777 / NBRC 106824 / NRRL Y48691) TaxID=653667 RepID=S9X1P1_SCHCR|nr:glutamate-ammonia ligase Gln1 [Schizosaccharomyces cryophilus OY26]EPY51022.1 glutamate-ammonia ligase Gln1 [Schizosaccharomyces cryophilus OY26]
MCQYEVDPLLSKASIMAKYANLEPLDGKVMAEYIWIDGFNHIRSKTMTLDQKPKSLEDLRVWNFDGSSTGQAPGYNSDTLLKPVAMYRDPIRRGDNILVLAACYTADGSANHFNHRDGCVKLMEKHASQDIWFGIEQEYTMLDYYDRPFGWPKGGFPGPQGPFYCGVGTGNVFARDIVEAHYKACLYAGINISGVNAEVMPSQWEYQVGPCRGIQMGDELWMSRFLLHRIAEDFGVKISFHPKPILGDWNGAGCHTNVSTKDSRAEGGMKAIEQYLEKFAKRHMDHIKVYGDDNDLRLTGKHETGTIEQFNYGIADRGASVRIPRSVAMKGCGYFEDRRPASSIDPYLVTGIITETMFEF